MKFEDHWINHNLNFVDPYIHTQNIEGFWFVFKRLLRNRARTRIDKNFLDYYGELMFRNLNISGIFRL